MKSSKIRRCWHILGVFWMLIITCLLSGLEILHDLSDICGKNSLRLLSFSKDVWPFRRCSGKEDVSKKLSLICQNIRPCIAIHIFAYCRPTAVAELLDKLSMSNYSSYNNNIPLIVHLDRPEEDQRGTVVWQDNKLVKQVLENFEWPHGPMVVDVKETHVGLKQSWLRAWEDPNPNDIMIALEDDMDISPLYFQWLLHILTKYNLWEQHNRDDALLGISLSPMLYDEVSLNLYREERIWSSEINIPLESPVYLHGAPSSWGGVYFGEPWKQFLAFATVRDAPPFYKEGNDTTDGTLELLLPASKVNTWAGSWKRFMFEYAYGRGAYMIYPSLSSAGLATSRFLSGEHYEEDFDSPMHASLVTDCKDLKLEKTWPDYRTLPLFDIFCLPIDRASYACQGNEFVEEICRGGPQYEELCRLWRKRRIS